MPDSRGKQRAGLSKERQAKGESGREASMVKSPAAVFTCRAVPSCQKSSKKLAFIFLFAIAPSRLWPCGKTVGEALEEMLTVLTVQRLTLCKRRERVGFVPQPSQRDPHHAGTGRAISQGDRASLARRSTAPLATAVRARR